MSIPDLVRNAPVGQISLVDVKKLARLAWATLAYNVAVIVWGGFVRASKSGAGCGTHWPLCKGHILPSFAEATTRIEFAHRITSGVAVLLTVFLATAISKEFHRTHPARRAMRFSVLFMVLESLVGAALVLLNHVAMDPSAARAVWMGIHLTNTFLLVASSALTAYFVNSGTSPSVHARRGIYWTCAIALGTILLVALAGSEAALADTLYPAKSLLDGLRQDITPGGHLILKIRTIHPFLAMFGACVVAVAATVVHSLAPGSIAKRAAIAAGVLTVTQVAIGFTNLMLLVPIWTQLLHLAVAQLVWIALVLMSVDALQPRAEGA